MRFYRLSEVTPNTVEMPWENHVEGGWVTFIQKWKEPCLRGKKKKKDWSTDEFICLEENIMKQCNCSSLAFHYTPFLVGHLYRSERSWPDRVVVSGTNSIWMSVTSGQVQGSILLSILFSIFNTNVNYGAEYSLQQVGWWQKNGEEWQINHKDVLPSPRCGLTGKVNLSWGKNDPMHKYIPDVKQLESSLEGKNLGGPSKDHVNLSHSHMLMEK